MTGKADFKAITSIAAVFFSCALLSAPGPGASDPILAGRSLVASGNLSGLAGRLPDRQWHQIMRHIPATDTAERSARPGDRTGCATREHSFDTSVKTPDGA